MIVGKLRKYGIIFLVLLMVLAAAPMAMAATATEIGQVNIGELFNEAGDYILSEDIVLSGDTKAIELSKDIEVTLDLNGHTISADTSTYRNLGNDPKDYGSIIYATSGDITIKDGVGGGKIWDTSAEKYNNHNDGVIRVEKGTHLTIEKAIIEVKEGIGITTYDDGTRVTFKDGEIKVEYGFGIGTNGSSITEPGSGIYVEGGTITVASADSAAIYHPSSGTLNISGGTLSAADGIQVKAGNVIITGGTITATGKHNVPPDGKFSGGGTNELGNALSLISHKNYKGQSMDVKISGSAMLIAEHADAIGVYVNSGDVSHVNSFVITGGTYSSDPSAYVKSPYVVKQVEGKYVVALAGVAVTPTAAELVLGLTPTAKLTASSDIEEDFTWASKNDDVVTVDKSGNITAVGAGTADVTATGAIGKSVGTCVVTVRAAAPVSVTPSKMELNIGATGKATAKYDAKDSITWKSSDTAVATVKDGTVTAVKAGIAVITAKGSKTSAACTVTVTDPASPDPVTLTPAPVDAGTVDKENNPVNKEEGKPENVEAATPAITEATEEGKAAVVSATKIEEKNLVATADGKLTISPVLAKSALEEVISADATVAPKNVVLLPIVQAAVTANNVAALAFTMTGEQLGAEENTVAGDVKVIKVLADGKGGQFSYASAAADYADKTFTLKDADGKSLALTDKVAKASTYTLVVFVADNGDFDLDATAGSVIDPVAVATNAATEPKSGGSSSGCNGGFGALALLAFAVLPFIRREKR